MTKRPVSGYRRSMIFLERYLMNFKADLTDQLTHAVSDL
jgi:hypothetical protein